MISIRPRSLAFSLLLVKFTLLARYSLISFFSSLVITNMAFCRTKLPYLFLSKELILLALNSSLTIRFLVA